MRAAVLVMAAAASMSCANLDGFLFNPKPLAAYTLPYDSDAPGVARAHVAVRARHGARRRRHHGVRLLPAPAGGRGEHCAHGALTATATPTTSTRTGRARATLTPSAPTCSSSTTAGTVAPRARPRRPGCIKTRAPCSPSCAPRPTPCRPRGSTTTATRSAAPWRRSSPPTTAPTRASCSRAPSPTPRPSSKTRRSLCRARR